MYTYTTCTFVRRQSQYLCRSHKCEASACETPMFFWQECQWVLDEAAHWFETALLTDEHKIALKRTDLRYIVNNRPQVFHFQVIKNLLKFQSGRTDFEHFKTSTQRLSLENIIRILLISYSNLISRTQVCSLKYSTKCKFLNLRRRSPVHQNTLQSEGIDHYLTLQRKDHYEYNLPIPTQELREIMLLMKECQFTDKNSS